jgi:hypothetical protein
VLASPSGSTLLISFFVRISVTILDLSRILFSIDVYVGENADLFLLVVC